MGEKTIRGCKVRARFVIPSETGGLCLSRLRRADRLQPRTTAGTRIYANLLRIAPCRGWLLAPRAGILFLALPGTSGTAASSIRVRRRINSVIADAREHERTPADCSCHNTSCTARGAVRYCPPVAASVRDHAVEMHRAQRSRISRMNLFLEPHTIGCPAHSQSKDGSG